MIMVIESEENCIYFEYSISNNNNFDVHFENLNHGTENNLN